MGNADYCRTHIEDIGLFIYGGVLNSSRSSRSYFMIVLTIFAPLVFGYFLSYAFRTVNAPLTGLLTSEFSLAPSQLGFLTSCYFVTATLAQLPLGLALDKYGPGRVQGTLMLLAALGAGLFARADGFVELAIGRGLIGLGVAGALMAGMKANVLSLPKERVALMNGAFIAIGSAGALATSLPLDWLLGFVSWRELFLGLAVASAVSAALILGFVPHMPAAVIGSGATVVGLRQIIVDPNFWRLAPLSALICGSAWAIQGLWIAAWLRDAGGMDRGQLADALFVMALALCLSALGFGFVLDQLRRRGIESDRVFAGIAAAVIAAELTLAFRWPVSVYLPLMCIGASGAATVVSYSITPKLFPPTSVARANGALNLLHFGVAFTIQNLVGLVVGRWSPDAVGHYPVEAYGAAFLCVAGLQALALLWFVWRASPVETPSEPIADGPNFGLGRWIASTVAVVGLSTIVFSTDIRARFSWVAPSATFITSVDAEPLKPVKQQGVDVLTASIEARFAEQSAMIANLQAKLESYERELLEIRPQFAELRHQLGEMQAAQIQAAKAAAMTAMPSLVFEKPVSDAIATIDPTTAQRTSNAPPVQRPAVGAHCGTLATEYASPIVIGFDRNQAGLMPSHHRVLDQLIVAVGQCPLVHIEIKGYSDNHGSDRLNAALSQKRADLTAKYFEAHGISAVRMMVDGLGPASPIATNASVEGRARNRRVELALRSAN